MSTTRLDESLGTRCLESRLWSICSSYVDRPAMEPWATPGFSRVLLCDSFTKTENRSDALDRVPFPKDLRGVRKKSSVCDRPSHDYLRKGTHSRSRWEAPQEINLSAAPLFHRNRVLK